MISMTSKWLRMRIGYLREITAGFAGPAGLVGVAGRVWEGAAPRNGRIIS